MNTVIQLYSNFTNHTLTCEADEASSYNWERQNDVIPSDSTGVNTNTLTLINLQPEDAGNYRCVATNASGSSQSIMLQLLFLVSFNAKQKHPGCKKSARPIRSSIANRYVRPKTLISVEAKKLLIKNLFNYLNDIQ